MFNDNRFRTLVLAFLFMGVAAITALPALANPYEIYFGSNSSSLDAQDRGILANVVEELQSIPSATVSLVGYTDSVGAAEYNKRLALRRANAAAKFLKSSGISGERITVESRGEATDGRDKATSRRVEINVSVPSEQLVLSSFAVVLDDNSEFIAGLPASNFRVFQGGKEREVKRVEYVTREYPTGIVLALDKSSTMKDAMPHLKSAVKDFISSKQPTDEIQLVPFSSRVSAGNRFSSDVGELTAAVDQIQVGGYTRLYDAIVVASQQLEKFAPPRLVILVTDGVDEMGLGKPASEADFATALSALEKSRTTVLAVGLGDKINSDELASIALTSGGAYFHVPNSDQLGPIFRHIEKKIVRGRYRIDFVADPTIAGPVVIASDEGHLITYR